MCVYTYDFLFMCELALNNLQWFICHETKPNQVYVMYMYNDDLTLNNPQ